MREQFYKPNGRGLCALCGNDVGAHDAGHKPYFTKFIANTGHFCKCGAMLRDVIHDVGRKLRCPEVQS